MRSVYKPSNRVAFDLALITIITGLLFHAAAGVPVEFSFGAILAAVALEFLLWVFWLKKVFSIEMRDGEMAGPGVWPFERVVIAYPEIDKGKTDVRRETKHYGYVDIWAKDGRKIRLYRHILGRGKVYGIVETVLDPLPDKSQEPKPPYHPKYYS